MKTKTKKTTFASRTSGIGLVEVMVAVVVLAFGLISLSYLQATLGQASSASRAATVAAQIANEVLEDRRAFTATAEYMAFDDVVTAAQVREGVSFVVNEDVTRYRLNPDPDGDPTTGDSAFEVVGNTEAFTDSQAEFKQIAVSVSWTTSTNETKSVALVDAISSAIPQDGLATSKSLTGQRTNPQVRIRENTEDGVIPIAIGEADDGSDIAAAASNPRPKQFAEGATGTTKFTVDTYIKDKANPLLQRQLDFAYASCVCQKGTPTADTVSYEPSYWTGVKYSTPKSAKGRAFGVIDDAVDQDANLCGTCCRDHHDAVSAAVKADPFRPANDFTSGDHNHYKTGSTVGSLVLAGSNDSYLEACRLIRVDGVYSVATDTELENLALLRMDQPTTGTYRLTDATVSGYADFIKAYVRSAHTRKAENASYPRSGGLPNALLEVVDGSTVPSALAVANELAATDTYTPRILDLNSDNKVTVAPTGTVGLAARGLYIDWLSPEAIEKIACIGNTSDTKCVPYKSMDLLELLPFVAVNVTQIAMWGSSDAEKASVRSDPIPLVRNGGGQANEFVRGRATGLQTGASNITARIGRSNSGLINTKPTDPDDLAQQIRDQEELVISTGTESAIRSAAFRARVVDSTGDNNFSVQNVSARIVSPAVDQPECSVGATTQTSDLRSCTLTSFTEPLQLEFGNFNYYTCAHLGSKWVYEPVTVRCVLPPSGKIKIPTYGTPTVRNYQLCSVASPSGTVDVTGVTTTGDGTVAEKAMVTISRNGSDTLIKTLDNLNPIFTATFKSTCP